MHRRRVRPQWRSIVTTLSRRRLGRSELRPNAVGLGGAWWGPAGDAETLAAIDRALELGMDFLDTYPGQNEELWGQVLAGRREQVFLQAKTSSHVRNEMRSNHTAAATRRSVENSLRALRTDYLDSVLIHGYDQLHFPEDPEMDMVDPLAPGQALDELLKMKEEGSIRHIGIGARAAAVHRRAIETGHIEIVLTYLEYNLLTQAAELELFPLCREQDVGVILASPLGMGLLTGRPVDAEDERRKIPSITEPTAGRMLAWCAEQNVDIRHLAIQYCLAAPVDGIVLPGQASREEVEGTWAAATSEISAETWRQFAAAFDLPADLLPTDS